MALGAVYALENYGLERVAIVDWDVHHGNGTQHLFESGPPGVFMCRSTRTRNTVTPAPVNAGRKARVRAKGFNLNLPFPPRSEDSDYLEAVRLKEERKKPCPACGNLRRN